MGWEKRNGCHIRGVKEKLLGMCVSPTTSWRKLLKYTSGLP